MSQLTPRQQRDEMDWVAEERKRAHELTTIDDYRNATMFALEVFATRGDERAKLEIKRRRRM
jgi:hypothetical protein